MTVKLKFKELEIMYTQIKRTNGGEKNNTPRSFTFPHKGGKPACAHSYTHTHRGTHAHENTLSVLSIRKAGVMQSKHLPDTNTAAMTMS